MNYLYAAIAAGLLLFGSVQWGKHLTQVEWDKDKAVRQALHDQTVKQNKEALDALESQYKKDKLAATSKAGRDAVARYLRERVLPTCATGADTTQGQPGIDGTASESGTGEPLEKFVTGCGLDALKVMRWQELCVRANCEIVD